jgi:predicted HTH transcriptional regulator
MLANADMARQGDLDGRGNLSEKMLRQWCEFFIDVADDQVTFMTGMLKLDALSERIAPLIVVRSESSQFENYTREATLALHHVLVAGPVSRGDFCKMTGMAERSARRVLAQLLKDRLLDSDNPKGAVSFNFALDALNILLPNLYPEAATTNTEL